MCILSWRNMIYIYIYVYIYIHVYIYIYVYMYIRESVLKVSWKCPESVLKVSCVCRCLCMCVYLSCTYTPASTTSTEGWIICRRVSGIHWEPQSGDGVIVQEHKLRQNQPEPQRDYNGKLTVHGLGLVTVADSLRQQRFPNEPGHPPSKMWYWPVGRGTPSSPTPWLQLGENGMELLWRIPRCKWFSVLTWYSKVVTHVSSKSNTMVLTNITWFMICLWHVIHMAVIW